MNGVIGMSGLLLDTDLSAEQQEYAEAVKHSGEALLAIINDILDFSKVEAGKLELEILDFDLRQAIEEVVELLAEPAQRKPEVEFTYFIHTEVPGTLRGDPGRLRQILLNFLSNALKFTERGEVVLEVSPGHRKEEKAPNGEEQARPHPATSALRVLQFAVRDTGIGIPPERRDRLFHSFSQVDVSTTRRYGGTGLGLAICKRLVELMHGEIGVESEPGTGSTFWFTVPLEQGTGGGQPVLPLHPDLRGLRVLIVDDNATNRLILQRYLTQWGMVIASAENGAQALASLRAAVAQGHPYEVVLLDYHMPEMDGLELARHIKADPVLAPLKLVLLTSAGQREEVKQAKGVSLEAALTKPIRQSHLFNTFVTLVGQALQPALPSPRAPVVPQLRGEREGQARPLILVAEDNSVNQRLVVRLLEKLGYRTDVAGNGLEVLQALSAIPYTAVLMDCQMPEMDGYEATRAIRQREAAVALTLHPQHPRLLRLPIIAMTANAMQGDREKCLAVGMDDYIAKPINPDQLKAALERWIPLLATDSEEPRTGKGSSAHSASSVLDLEEALARVEGDRAFLADLVQIYLEESPAMLAAIQAAVAANDPKALQHAAHTLKGSVGNFGATAAFAAAFVLEGMGRQEEISGATAALAVLKQELARLQPALAALTLEPSA